MTPPRSTLFGLLFALGAIPLLAAPAVTSVSNAASNIQGSFPGGAIAQGAIFIVKGTGLGPANISISPTPFQSTTLSGTSVAVMVGGTTVNALMYYTSDKQIAALLPSNTPTGTGTITVTFDGQLSPPTAFRGVVANNLGIFTVDSSGTASGIVTYADYSLVSPAKAANCGGPNTTCGAANPGDTLILWGTGLGPVSGNEAAGAGLGQNMPNIPLRLWLGGVQAPVVYQGRSGCCIGEDQIVFTVPDNVPTGCAVPLLIQIGGQSSNNVLMPLAKGSRDCTSVDPALGGLTQRLVAGPVTVGQMELDHFRNSSGAGFRDTVQVNFLKFTAPLAYAPFVLTSFDTIPLGTCTAESGLKAAGGDVLFGNLSLLDAGTSATIQGPSGSVTVTPKPDEESVLSAAGTFLVPGDYTITGAGGKDVGPFTANLNIPVAPTLTSPTTATGLTVSRAQGMTVTWNRNGSTGNVEIVVGSGGTRVACRVAASAGTFTVPPYVLGTLPNGTNTFFDFGLGADAFPAASVPFSATGINVGVAQAFIGSNASFGGFSITN